MPPYSTWCTCCIACVYPLTERSGAFDSPSIEVFGHSEAYANAHFPGRWPASKNAILYEHQG